ncbi:hypothetical protein GGX14DRAFT_637044 [Mycena pura]|uniref:Protein kinase domain-containing protein n=1 Tax=Mycena pura TaxID=153505 RepID=A0AAD6VA80_9AGAR|nr:hypothetical protein GGX14DRAFT_637044 [Mycena pura]
MRLQNEIKGPQCFDYFVSSLSPRIAGSPARRQACSEPNTHPEPAPAASTTLRTRSPCTLCPAVPRPTVPCRVLPLHPPRPLRPTTLPVSAPTDPTAHRAPPRPAPVPAAPHSPRPSSEIARAPASPRCHVAPVPAPAPAAASAPRRAGAGPRPARVCRESASARAPEPTPAAPTATPTTQAPASACARAPIPDASAPAAVTPATRMPAAVTPTMRMRQPPASATPAAMPAAPAHGTQAPVPAPAPVPVPAANPAAPAAGARASTRARVRRCHARMPGSDSCPCPRARMPTVDVPREHDPALERDPNVRIRAAQPDAHVGVRVGASRALSPRSTARASIVRTARSSVAELRRRSTGTATNLEDRDGRGVAQRGWWRDILYAGETQCWDSGGGGDDEIELALVALVGGELRRGGVGVVEYDGADVADAGHPLHDGVGVCVESMGPTRVACVEKTMWWNPGVPVEGERQAGKRRTPSARGPARALAPVLARIETDKPEQRPFGSGNNMEETQEREDKQRRHANTTALATRTSLPFALLKDVADHLQLSPGDLVCCRFRTLPGGGFDLFDTERADLLSDTPVPGSAPFPAVSVEELYRTFTLRPVSDVRFHLLLFKGTRLYAAELLEDARFMASLSHSDFVLRPVRTVIDAAGHFVASSLECVLGATRPSPLTWDIKVAWCMDVAAALSWLHTHASAWGDLKLGNIVLCRRTLPPHRLQPLGTRHPRLPGAREDQERRRRRLCC